MTKIYDKYENKITMPEQSNIHGDALLVGIDFTTSEPVSPDDKMRFLNSTTGQSNITETDVAANTIYSWNTDQAEWIDEYTLSGELEDKNIIGCRWDMDTAILEVHWEDTLSAEDETILDEIVAANS